MTDAASTDSASADAASVPPDPTQAAVSLFWTRRADQIKNLQDKGAAGGAARSGGHMDSVQELVSHLFATEMPEATVATTRAVVPGYYRATKNWDLGVTYKGALVAAIEFKAQVGSVGNNANNRTEEAIGNSVDVWAAQTHNTAFGLVAPWLGLIFILESTAKTEQPVRRSESLFPVDPVFAGKSYNESYQITMERFMAQNVYQGGWYITTKQEDDGSVSYDEPLVTATGRSFRAAVRGRVEYVRSVLG